MFCILSYSLQCHVTPLFSKWKIKRTEIFYNRRGARETYLSLFLRKYDFFRKIMTVGPCINFEPPIPYKSSESTTYSIQLKKWSSHLTCWTISAIVSCVPEKFLVSSTGFKPMTSALLGQCSYQREEKEDPHVWLILQLLFTWI